MTCAAFSLAVMRPQYESNNPCNRRRPARQREQRNLFRNFGDGVEQSARSSDRIRRTPDDAARATHESTGKTCVPLIALMSNASIKRSIASLPPSSFCLYSRNVPLAVSTIAPIADRFRGQRWQVADDERRVFAVHADFSGERQIVTREHGIADRPVAAERSCVLRHPDHEPVIRLRFKRDVFSGAIPFFALDRRVLVVDLQVVERTVRRRACQAVRFVDDAHSVTAGLRFHLFGRTRGAQPASMIRSRPVLAPPRPHHVRPCALPCGEWCLIYALLLSCVVVVGIVRSTGGNWQTFPACRWLVIRPLGGRSRCIV